MEEGLGFWDTEFRAKRDDKFTGMALHVAWTPIGNFCTERSFRQKRQLRAALGPSARGPNLSGRNKLMWNGDVSSRMKASRPAKQAGKEPNLYE